jgi:hypothetical protein
MMSKSTIPKHYVTWFNNEKLTVDDPKHDLVFASLMNGVLAGGPLMGELACRTLARF